MPSMNSVCSHLVVVVVVAAFQWADLELCKGEFTVCPNSSGNPMIKATTRCQNCHFSSKSWFSPFSSGNEKVRRLRNSNERVLYRWNVGRVVKRHAAHVTWWNAYLRPWCSAVHYQVYREYDPLAASGSAPPHSQTLVFISSTFSVERFLYRPTQPAGRHIPMLPHVGDIYQCCPHVDDDIDSGCRYDSMVLCSLCTFHVAYPRNSSGVGRKLLWSAGTRSDG